MFVISPRAGPGCRSDDNNLPAVDPRGTRGSVPSMGNAIMISSMPFTVVLSTRKDLLCWTVGLCVSTYIQDE